MVKTIHDMSSWGAALNPQRIQEEEADQARQADWEATRQVNSTNQWANSQPQSMPVRHVGKQVAGSLWELFVVFDPVDALQQQFESLRPEFIAIHDVGTHSSRRMLQGLAAATGKPVHQLHIRRQGHGVPMARLEFVELPVNEGQTPLRLYTTEIDADSVNRHRLALLLLAYSRLGAVMVGDMAPHVMVSALDPLKQVIRDGPWMNRRLLTLPLTKSATVASLMQQVVGRSHIKNSVTPQVARPAEAWNYLRSTWNGLRDELAEDGVTLPELQDTRTNAPVKQPCASANGGTPSEIRAAARAAQAVPSGRQAALQTHMQRCAELKGLLSCTVFDLQTQQPVVQWSQGEHTPAAVLAAQGAMLLGSLSTVAQALKLGAGPIDSCISVGGHHIVVKSFAHAPNLAFHALFDRTTNLTLVRLQLQRLDLQLEDALQLR
jgi:hypothetical protein